jgi:hypothetical protein
MHPECSHPLYNYGIGSCAGCVRFPVVLYKAPRSDTWRCQSCYTSDYGTPPNNLVSA